METAISMYSKKVQELREKRYVVRPIRRKGGWVPPDHDSAFMNDGARQGYVVPVLPGNVLVDPLKDFTSEDKVSLAEELGLENAQVFNVHTKKNFWRGNTVYLDRNGLHLNCENPADFVKYLILKSDSENIAPNWASRFDKGTYKFALCEEGEELLDKVSNLEDKKNAYIYLSKIDKSVDKMKDFLYVYYLTKKDAKRPPRAASVDWLKQELGRIIEDDLATYLSIANDKDYNVKLLIQKSIEVGALYRDRHNYSMPGADKPIGVLEDLIAFLDDTKNQEVKIKLLHQIENTTKK